MTTTFDPSSNAADAYAVVSDTAPMEFWYDFAEAGSNVHRVIVLRDYLRTRGYSPTIKVLADAAAELHGSNR